MRIEVLYFASAREATGVSGEEIEVPAATTIADLRPILVGLHPALAGSWPALRFAVDQRFEPPTTALSAHARVALLPPVSGG
jgi:sulfur-carrier protein